MRAWPSRTRLFSTQPPARSTFGREHQLGARRGAPVVGARPRAHRLPEAGEEARDLEGDELAGVGLDVARLVAAVGLDVVADEPQAPEQAGRDPGVGDRRVDLVVLRADDRVGVLRLPEDRRRDVARAGAGRQRGDVLPVVHAPALREAGLDAVAEEHQPDAVQLVDRLDALVEEVFVLAEVVRRGSGPLVDVARVAEQRADDLSGQQLEGRVVDVARAVPGLLAGNDPVGEKRIGEGRKGAVEIRVAPAERQLEDVRADRLQAELAGGAGADVRAVHVERIEEAEGALRRVVEGAQEQSGAVVDLRPVHLVVSGHVDKPVAELDVHREGRLRAQTGGREESGCKQERSSHLHHFKSCGDRFEPCTATWHVVQLR